MMKSEYEMELGYQVDLMRATALRSRSDELAEELIKFGELASAGKLIGNNRDRRIAALRKLVEEIKNDQAQLEKFRWAYVYRIATKGIEGGGSLEAEVRRARICPIIVSLVSANKPEELNFRSVHHSTESTRHGIHGTGTINGPTFDTRNPQPFFEELSRKYPC